MFRKLLTLSVLVLASSAHIACAQDSKPSAVQQTETTAENTQDKAQQEAQNAENAAQVADAQAVQALDQAAAEGSTNPSGSTSTASGSFAPVAPAAETTTASEGALIDQYKLKKDKNFKAIEFELAKELALHRSSSFLNSEEDKLFSAALSNLTTVFGSVSTPEKEETYFEYQNDPDTGEFMIVLVKDSYVKAQRGDICQIGTQVFLRTSVQEEFAAKLASITPPPTEMSQEVEANGTASPVAPPAPLLESQKAPSNVTQIECYNDERPTYSQRLVM